MMWQWQVSIAATWLNDRDQFLYPQQGWQQDEEFLHNCLVYTLLHGQNRVRGGEHGCHWLPYSEQQVQAWGVFSSSFMQDFLKGRVFSTQAQQVLAAGLALWRYYIEECRRKHCVDEKHLNASLYDVREFFQGRSAGGRMNPKSSDEKYNGLMNELRGAMKVLGGEVEKKVWEYGFLRGEDTLKGSC